MSGLAENARHDGHSGPVPACRCAAANAADDHHDVRGLAGNFSLATVVSHLYVFGR